MKNLFKRTVTMVLIIAICISSVGNNIIFAGERANNSTRYINKNILSISDYLTKEDIDFMNNLEKVYPYFTFDENGALSITKKMSDLKSLYNFDDDFLVRLNKLLKSDIATNGATNLNIPNLNIGVRRYFDDLQPMLHASDWKIYFTYEEVIMSFFVAAQIGPSAIIAALAGLGTTIGGPVGTLIGTIVGYLGAADFMYLVIRAAALKKGVYIGLDWDGPFPVPTQGTW